MQLQGLLRELLRAVGPDNARRRATLGALGASLAAQGRHEDAAVAHASAGDLRAAALQYQSAGEWGMALALAGARRWPALLLRLLAVQPCSSSLPGSGAALSPWQVRVVPSVHSAVWQAPPAGPQGPDPVPATEALM